MSETLCDFSGKYGDIIWSLATTREISRMVGHPVDFAVMPYYASLLPLIVGQEYIDKAFIIEDWLRIHSCHGDQPWQPPRHIEEKYKRCYHLTYRAHPGISAPNMPLIDFIAYQQNMKLREPVVPFVRVPDEVEELAQSIHFSSGTLMEVVGQKRLIAYAFNEQYEDQKKEFFMELYDQLKTEIEFFNLNTIGWREAAWVSKNALAFVGCRSANWVVAQGVGQEAITFEPHPARHQSGHLGNVFRSPYGREIPLPFAMPPREAAKAAASLIRAKRERESVVAAGK